jgi:hypothetical protein
VHAGVTMQHKNERPQLGFDNYVMSEYTTCFGLQGYHHVIVFIKNWRNYIQQTKSMHKPGILFFYRNV